MPPMIPRLLSLPTDPGWASINRGVLVCDECCSIHRSLGRHISIVKHLRHSPWSATLLQVGGSSFRCGGRGRRMAASHPERVWIHLLGKLMQACAVLLVLTVSSSKQRIVLASQGHVIPSKPVHCNLCSCPCIYVVPLHLWCYTVSLPQGAYSLYFSIGG